MFTQIPVYILCAMPSNQVCQCLRQFGMPFFQLCRRRTETLQRSLTQMQGIGFRRFFRFRDQPDRNRAYRRSSPASCGNTDGAIIFKLDAAILFAAKESACRLRRRPSENAGAGWQAAVFSRRHPTAATVPPVSKVRKAARPACPTVPNS